MPLDSRPDDARRDERRPALRQLSAQLLRPQAGARRADGAVHWIEAPDPAREVGAVLRRVKRLLLDGCSPDDILIALRDWTLYGGQIAAQGQAYGLPLALHYGEPLAQQSGGRGAARPAAPARGRLPAARPARRAALALFRRAGAGRGAVDLLERISRGAAGHGRARGVAGGGRLAARPAGVPTKTTAKRRAVMRRERRAN